MSTKKVLNSLTQTGGIVQVVFATVAHEMGDTIMNYCVDIN